MKRKAVDRARVVFKFPDGRTSALALSEVERQLQSQYHRMAASDSPELRAAGMAKLEEAAEDAAAAQLARLKNAKAGFSSGEEREAERRPEWDRWQARADELHKANPRRSKAEICRIIAEELGMEKSGRGVAARVKIVGTERARSKK